MNNDHNNHMGKSMGSVAIRRAHRAMAFNILIYGLFLLVLIPLPLINDQQYEQDRQQEKQQEKQQIVASEGGVQNLNVTLTEQRPITSLLSPAMLEDMRPSSVSSQEVVPEPFPDELNSDALLPDLIEEQTQLPERLEDIVLEPTENLDLGENNTDRDSDLEISQVINNYVVSRIGELNRGYVEACIRYRNRYGRRSECPENEMSNLRGNQKSKQIADGVFANLRRKAESAHMSRSLETANTFLENIIDELSPAAEEVRGQASTRLSLNNRYLSYLNGNTNPAVADVNMMMGFVNDYGRTVMPTPYQFRCKQWPRPCSYKFTGFTVKKPETREERPNAFKETTPLFMPSKN
ncbi:MAG: hypothetical protein P8M72_04755 [Gammaproteobacteria bacterium]|nr:hypothetical protein [Gammaproteobacteria bacterium]